MQKISLITTTVLLLVLTLALSQANAAQVTTIFKVEKVTCSSCLLHIGGELQQFPGYKGMRADLAHGLIHVQHDEEMDENGLANFISVIGYPARIVQPGELAGIMKTTATNKSGCSKSGCNATSASWKKLIKKIGGE